MSSISGGIKITFTYYNPNPAAVPNTNSVIVVLTSQTLEPAYGLSFVNDLNERLVSTLFNAGNYVGNATVSAASIRTEDTSVYSYTFSSPSATSPLIFWKYPSVGEWYCSSTDTAKRVLVRSSTVPSSYPVGYVFDMSPSSSSDTYGIRVRNASGQVTFDGGHRPLRVAGVLTGASFSTSENSYTTVTDAAYCTNLYYFVGGRGGNNGGYQTGVEYYGSMRHSGSTLYTKKSSMYVEPDSWPYGAAEVQLGNTSGLIIPYIDTSSYT